MNGTIPVFTLTLVGVSRSILQAQQRQLQSFLDQFFEFEQDSQTENEAIVKQFDGVRAREVADALWRDVRPIWMHNETVRGSQ